LSDSGYSIEGPVQGPGHIIGGYLGDLAAVGYVEEEYFVSGLAQDFRPVGSLAPDGAWQVERASLRPFTTRVIVHRPIDPARFNGVVLCEWANVSSPNEVSCAVNETAHRFGYVYAAISAQPIGIDGLESDPRSGLRRLDPDRYGPLHIPGDGCSYDVFAAVAGALMGVETDGPSLLPGLTPRWCVAMGESQSASRLVSYLNAVHHHHRLFTAFLLLALRGGANDFGDTEVIPGESRSDFNERYFGRIIPATIREDPGAPVLILQSEAEVRIPRVPSPHDNDWIRVWELAGSVHRSACDVGYRADVSERDGWDDPFANQTQRMVRFSPTVAAAGLALVRWAGGGMPLAIHPRLQRDAHDGNLELDEFGTARGGVRMPEVEVPTAVYDSASSPMWGTRTPFAPELLRKLYADAATYVERVRRAAEAGVAAGVLLPGHVEDYVADALGGGAGWVQSASSAGASAT
jgi:hypothetical protein